MVKLMWTAVVVLAAVGCSAAGDRLEAPMAGDVVLSPEPAVTAAVEVAAARWAAATGLHIVVAPGGVPVRVVADAIDPSGYRVCAFTSTAPSVGPVDLAIDIDPPARTCHGVDQVLAHEVGHVIARTFAPDTGDVHTLTGLMKPRNGTPAIDEVSLAAVCAFAPCTVFQPESEIAPTNVAP